MAAKSASNLLLFTNEDGSPMVFVITPGDTKKRLRPIVESGGGLLTSKETPGAIRLVASDCKAGKQVVCSDFVFDSYKNGKLCNIDDYRLESKPAIPKSHVTVKSEKALKSGRIKYSPDEDQAILDYIKKFKGQLKLSGNKIWQEMEEKNVTCHRWQSMRSRYLSFLRQSTRISSFKGKLEFVGRKNISRSQTTGNDNTVDNVSSRNITEPRSHSFQNNGKVNEERKDEENVHALPDEQQTLTSLNHNHDENIQQILETSYLGKKQNAKTPNDSESQTIEAKDVYVTSCISPIAGTSSAASCEEKNQQDDIDVSKSNIKESTKSCHIGIRKYFKSQSKNITSDKVADKSGNENVIVPQYDKDNTNGCNHRNKNSADDCAPVLKCNQLFKNFKKLQMISSMCPTQAQILHALYVSNGCLDCALHYLHKGLLPNGQEIWKREEDIAISFGNVAAIEKIINKRGQKAVTNRKQFLSSF